MAKKETSGGKSTKSNLVDYGLSKKEVKELPWNTQEYRDARYDQTQPISEHRVSAARQQEANRIVGEAEGARIRRIADTADGKIDETGGAVQYSPYIEQLRKKNPYQAFSVMDNKTGQWIKVKPLIKGGDPDKPDVGLGTVAPTGYPTGVVPVAPTIAPVTTVTPVVSPNLPVAAGVPQAAYGQMRPGLTPATAMPVRTPAVVPQVMPSKVLSTDKMYGMGQRAMLGQDKTTRDSGSYSKKQPTNEFKFD